MNENRRALLRRGLAFTSGAAAAVAAHRLAERVGPHRLPINGGYAAGGDARPDLRWAQGANAARRGALSVRWRVVTDQPLVALTFDDGPGPDWTPMVLDALDRHRVRATFFTVGQRMTRFGPLVADRLARHEIGNHTWAHRDLAQLDERGVQEQLLRAHAAIRHVTGQHARLMRPPWGHLGGSTLVIAEQLGYDVVMWSHKMREARYAAYPPGQVRDIVDNIWPGAIILAHDVGASTRLVALNQLDEIITGIHARGFRLVTVSDLIVTASAAVNGPGRA